MASSLGSDSSNDVEEDDGRTSVDSNEENRKVFNQKRNRTTILPEQQDYLMSKYSIESNPSRKMLEEISSEVKLKKRVVQVWFQNTRARERKGNFKMDFNSTSNSIENNSIISRKCLHCSLIFKLKSTLETHLLSKHIKERYAVSSIRSSTSRTRSPASRASSCSSIVAVPYSSA